MVGVKEKIKPIWVYFGHIQLVYSSFAYSNTFSKKLVIQTNLKFHFDRSKGGKKLGGVMLPGLIGTHFRLMRI